MNFCCKILIQIYLLVLENLAVVTLPLCDDVTTELFVEEILYLKAYNKLQLPL